MKPLHSKTFLGIRVLKQVLFRGHDANAYSIITFPFFMDCVARETGFSSTPSATNEHRHEQHTQTVNNEQNEFMRQLPVISPDIELRNFWT